MYFLHFATPASVPTVVFAAAYPRTGPNGSSHSAAPGHAARGVIYRASAFQMRGPRRDLPCFGIPDARPAGMPYRTFGACYPELLQGMKQRFRVSRAQA